MGGEDTHPSVSAADGLPRRTASPSLARHLGIAAEPPGLEGKQQPAPSGAGAGAEVAGMEEEGRKSQTRSAGHRLGLLPRAELVMPGSSGRGDPLLAVCWLLGASGMWHSCLGHCEGRLGGQQGRGLGNMAKSGAVAGGCSQLEVGWVKWKVQAGAGWGRPGTSTAWPPGLLQSPSADDFSGVQAADAIKGQEWVAPCLGSSTGRQVCQPFCLPLQILLAAWASQEESNCTD